MIFKAISQLRNTWSVNLAHTPTPKRLTTALQCPARPQLQIYTIPIYTSSTPSQIA